MSIIKGTNQIVAGFGGTKRSIGEVYFSQSSLATDNSGALPLFTGETIASANTIYPDFYNWVSAHTELQCTSEEYESALSTYGECAKYAIKSQITSYEWNGATSSMSVSGVYTKSNTPAVGDIIYNDEACSTPSVGDDGVTRTVLTIVSTNPYTFTASFGFQDAQGDPRFTLVTSHNVTINNGSLRLPLLKNYIKAANTSEGITQKEAGLPNITGQTGVNTTGGVGAFSNTTESIKGTVGISGSTTSNITSYFDASRSSAVYGNSDTVTPAHTTLYPWVVAYTAAIPASTAQAAQFQQGLSGKADTNLGNVASNLDYVVESYSDDSGNWYRVYKSGWVEQGGHMNVPAQITEYNFFKPYASNVKVTLFCGRYTLNFSTAMTNERIYAVAGTPCIKFGINNGSNTTEGMFWRAEGQGA